MRKLGIFLILLSLFSCKYWQFQGVGQEYHQVSEATEDTLIFTIIQPYKHKLDSVMQVVIANLDHDLRKSRPSGTLGNWMADACVRQAERISGSSVDLGLFNYGGIRRPFLNKGPVTLGMMYELMPFENQLVLLKIEGRWLQEALNWTCKKGGEPLSGLKLNMTTRVATLNNGREIHGDSVYHLITNDFMLEGGDGYTMLTKAASVERLGLLRDALVYDMMHHPLVMELLEERRVINE